MRRPQSNLCLILLLLLSAMTALADFPLEIIELKGRPVEEVIPIIRPFIAPGGSVTGMNNQLILRTSRENLREIQTILQRIDRPPRRLLISVRQGSARLGDNMGVATDINAQVGKNGSIGVGRPVPKGEVRLHGLNASSKSDLDVTQRVQTLEGRPAFITAGQSIPVTESQFIRGGQFPAYGSSTRYRDVGSGFYALPRLSGDRVTIEISPRLQRPGTVGGHIDVQHAQTVVSGRLGEWIPVGGSSRSTGGETSGIGRRITTRNHRDNAIYLKVDEIP